MILQPPLLDEDTLNKLLDFHRSSNVGDKMKSQMFEDVQSFGTSFYFESRVKGGIAQQLDFLVCVDRLGAVSLKKWLQTSFEYSQQYDWFIELLAQWVDPSDPLRDILSAVWLEWDDFEGSSAPFGVSLTLHSALQKQPQKLFDWLYCRFGKELINEDNSRLFFDALNEACVPIHFSIMAQRESRSVKFYTQVKRDCWRSFFESLGWENAIGDFQRKMDSLFPRKLCNTDLFFDIDLSDVGLTYPVRTSLNWSLNPFLDQQVTRNRWLDYWRKKNELSDNLIAFIDGWSGRDIGLTPNLPAPFRQSRWVELKWVCNLGDWNELKSYWGFSKPKRHFLIRE